MKTATRFRLARLRALPRHTPGKTQFDSLVISYLDPLALYHGYRDVFLQKIYHFESEASRPYVIDVGGYIGIATMYFKRLYPQADVLVFEPDPSVAEVLNENIKSNRLTDVEVVEAGAARVEGMVPFYPDAAGGGNTFGTESERAIRAKMVRLFDYIDRPVDFLKMNVEGMEDEVIEDIEPKLDLVRELVLEYHCFRRLPQTLDSILGRLNRNGFRYVVTDIPHLSPVTPYRVAQRGRHFNLVHAWRN